MIVVDDIYEDRGTVRMGRSRWTDLLYSSSSTQKKAAEMQIDDAAQHPFAFSP
jgi:hypothetical protein